MEWLPEDYEGAWTLKGSSSRKGVCLHSGEEAEVTLLPSNEVGFFVSFANQAAPPVRLKSTQVVHSPLCTTLDLGIQRLSTVEHLLAALVGCGLTHVHIFVSCLLYTSRAHET